MWYSLVFDGLSWCTVVNHNETVGSLIQNVQRVLSLITRHCKPSIIGLNDSTCFKVHIGVTTGSKAKDDFQIDALLSASDWLLFEELQVDSLRAPASQHQFSKFSKNSLHCIVMSVGVRDCVRGLEMHETNNDSNVMNWQIFWRL